MRMADNVGLFFGSFNPIHNGHLIIAAWFVEFTALEEVWFVVSPHNPLKQKQSLLHANHRYYMTHLAIGDDYPKLKASRIEFDLPVPSYTVVTLAHLQEKYASHRFSLIMGSDNLSSLPKWKNHEVIMQNHNIYVYPRIGFLQPQKQQERIIFTDAPIIELSSSFIRNAVGEGRDVRYMMPEKVWKYMREMHFYEL